MRRVIFATANEGKMREIKMIMGDMGLEILSMKEAGIEIKTEENGKSFEENALLKARAVAAVTHDLVLADDSGLEVDWLNKEPGIYSARYLGEDTSYDEKNADILRRMKEVPREERRARFVCAIAAVFPGEEGFTVTETVEGIIGYEPKGDNGFGYDPIFYLPELGKTTAELTEDEKNLISHRGKALRSMMKALKERLEKEPVKS